MHFPPGNLFVKLPKYARSKPFADPEIMSIRSCWAGSTGHRAAFHSYMARTSVGIVPVHAAGRFADQQNRQEALWIGVATKQQDPGLGSIGHSSRVGSAAGPAIAGLRR